MDEVWRRPRPEQKRTHSEKMGAHIIPKAFHKKYFKKQLLAYKLTSTIDFLNFFKKVTARRRNDDALTTKHSETKLYNWFNSINYNPTLLYVYARILYWISPLQYIFELFLKKWRGWRMEDDAKTRWLNQTFWKKCA